MTDLIEKIDEKYEELVKLYKTGSTIFYKGEKHTIFSVERYNDGNVSVILDGKTLVKGEDVFNIKGPLMAETIVDNTTMRFYSIPDNGEKPEENGIVKIDKDDERFIKYGGTSL